MGANAHQLVRRLLDRAGTTFAAPAAPRRTSACRPTPSDDDLRDEVAQ